MSTSTLANLRARGEGPPYRKIGRSVRYPQDALIAWLESEAPVVGGGGR